MKHRLFIILSMSGLLLLGACQSPQKKAKEEIEKMEQAMLDTQTFTIDNEKAAELSLAYRDYIKEYPEDTVCADYLYKLCEISSATGKHGEAVTYLDQLIESYPDWKKLPDAMFLKGFILEDKMQNLNTAQKAYQALIDRFPEHPFSENARVIIQNLGISADSLVKRFEEQQADSRE
jgi:outer membrane protein assembly factor BamD (BamD/ComL family)